MNTTPATKTPRPNDRVTDNRASFVRRWQNTLGTRRQPATRLVPARNGPSHIEEPATDARIVS